MITHWTGTSIPLKDLAAKLENNEIERRLTSETLTNIIENLSNNSYKRLLYATKIIFLVSNSDENCNQIKDKGGIPLLINLLSYEDEEEGSGEDIRINSALALANLARQASCQEVIARESGIPALVRLYQQCAKKSQIHTSDASLAAIKSLCTNSKHKKTIIQLGLDKNLLKSSVKPKPAPVKSPTFRMPGKKKKKKESKESNGESVEDTSLLNSKNTEHSKTEERQKSWRHSMPGPYKPDWNKSEERPRAQRSVSVEKDSAITRKLSQDTIKPIEDTKQVPKEVNPPEKQITFSLNDSAKQIITETKPKKHRDKTLKKTKSAPPVSAEINTSEEEEPNELSGVAEEGSISGSLKSTPPTPLMVPSIDIPESIVDSIKKTERTPITRSRTSKAGQKKTISKSLVIGSGSGGSNKLVIEKKRSSRTHQFKEKDSKSMRTKSLKEAPRNIEKKKRDYTILPLHPDKVVSPNDSSERIKPEKKFSKQRSRSGSKKPQFVQVKCIWDTDKRYIKVPYVVGVEGLFNAVQKEYKQTVASIKFMDSDNDFITITKDSDIEMCFDQQGPIVLFIDYKNPSGKVTQQETPSPQPLLATHKSDGWNTIEWENYPWRIPHQDLDLKNAPCLGRGYFGEVRLGKWRGGNVACKVIYRTSFRDKTDEEMFIREVNVLSKLRHPQVILFMGACIDTDDKIIVTEYMSKGSLYEILHNGSELTNPQLLNIAKDITLGMSYLHGEKILHRDLNCKNILINGSMSAKVADFGLSRIKAHQDSTISATMGAVAWMAPEVIADASQYTTKADVYSHGIIMWEMWTRKNPVPAGMTPLQMAKMIEQDNYRPEIPSLVPREWSDLIKLCWDKSPDIRPTFVEVLGKITEIELRADTIEKLKLNTLKISSSPELGGMGIVTTTKAKALFTSSNRSANIDSNDSESAVESDKSISEVDTAVGDGDDDYVDDESL